MKSFFMLIIFILALPSATDDIFPLQLYIFNVGQGSSAIITDQNSCYHFDSGGEINPIQAVKKICYNKQNILFISHFDKDHISFIPSLKRNLQNLCKYEFSSQPHKKQYLLSSQIPDCKITKPLWLKTLYHPTPQNVVGAAQPHPILANHYSLVWQINKKVIIAGDSTCADELKWINQVSPLVSILVLGHHGSQTSTCLPLLSRLPKLHTAIASARKQKYGHPHLNTLLRLKSLRNGLTPVRTQDWGTLIYSL